MAKGKLLTCLRNYYYINQRCTLQERKIELKEIIFYKPLLNGVMTSCAVTVTIIAKMLT